MTHELTHNPIKLRIVDLKLGEWKKTYVFVGSVPDDIKKELIKVERIYNKNGKPLLSSKIKKFYGVSWQKKLGLDSIKTINTRKKGGNEEYDFEDLSREIIAGDDNSENTDIDNIDIDSIINDDLGMPNMLTDDLGIPDMSKQLISESDIQNTDIQNTDIQNTITSDVLSDADQTQQIEKSGAIYFIFNTISYPTDNILEFKYKIFTELNIPIYRQHLWFKYRNKSYPAHYNLTVSNNSVNINIEKLISFYTDHSKASKPDSKLSSRLDSKTKKPDSKLSSRLDSKTTKEASVEGIPIDMEYYKNKDLIRITAQDTFNLLYTNFHKYGVDEYFLVDLNSLLKPSEIYDKLRKDKYQLDVIYYGFIILYFPMITYQIFSDYLKNERNMHELYTELVPDKSALKRQYEYESSITDEAYESLSDKNKIKKKLFSSITNTIVSINNFKQDIEVLLILRNIFDELILSDTITYCKANLLYDDKRVILKKAHFNEPEPRENIPLNSLLIKIKINADTNENMKLILFKNGNYIVKTVWREENHMDFNKITKKVSEKVNPILLLINKLKDRVKYYNTDLKYVDKTNIQFTETGFVFYYDDDVTDARFNVFKNILEDYRRAGIIMTKENMSISQEYFFRKGMYKYDSSRIEKSIVLANYYDYLSNGVVYQKWSTIFERTRLFTVTNISSKLKISINGIRNETEIDFFFMYLLGMLNIYNRNAASVKRVIGETINTKTKKTLKNLKIQDPLLYDFKKIYKSDVVYSKICQKPYQPLILSEIEYKNLPKNKQATAVKYWNFTKEKEVWYSCPNPKFPYIKFIVKQHPKDYCIPCCKKIAMNENVNQKKQDMHNTCIKNHIYTGEKINLTKGSHYIATYGKNIEVGRISRLPEHTLEPLFFDTYSPEGGIDQECVTADGYYLFGVDQHTANMRNIGYLYCIVHGLNKSIDDFLSETISLLKKHPDKFRVLLDGNAGLYFKNSEDIANAILTINNEKDIMHNKYLHIPWNDLFITIGYYFFGINTVLFRDKNKELIDMILPRDLKTADEMFPISHKNLVVLQRGKKYYPVYLLNTEIFKRTGIIDTRLFLNESGLITTITAVVRKHFESNTYNRIKSHIDMSVINKFVKMSPGIFITSYFINYANLCYAVLLDWKGKPVYFPISASHYSLHKNINLIFEPFNTKYATDINTLLKFFSIYNKWVDIESKNAELENINIYPYVQVERWLSVKKSMYGSGSSDLIGFICNNINYYCKTFDKSKLTGIKNDDTPIQYILHDPIKINQLIHQIKSGKKQLTSISKLDNKLQYATYNYYLYQLVLLQFINVFNAQRNTSLRKKLLVVLAKTNFDKSMEKLREFISKQIIDIDDKAKLKNIIGRFLTDHHDKRKMVEDIKTTYFEFDKTELEKLRHQSYNKILSELHKISKKFVTLGDIKNKKIEFPNILVACGQSKNNNLSYCKNNKFIISKEKLNGILSILAFDIMNPFKWKWLFNSVHIERTVDFFKFIRRPAETITVEFI